MTETATDSAHPSGHRVEIREIPLIDQSLIDCECGWDCRVSSETAEIAAMLHWLGEEECLHDRSP